MRVDLDPHTYLKVATAVTGRDVKFQYRSIIDCISETSRRKREDDEIDMGKVVMRVKSTPGPKLKHVSPVQSVYGN